MCLFAGTLEIDYLGGGADIHVIMFTDCENTPCLLTHVSVIMDSISVMIIIAHVTIYMGSL